jgi:GMP synthase-like glutamine amidotransferase
MCKELIFVFSCNIVFPHFIHLNALEQKLAILSGGPQTATFPNILNLIDCIVHCGIYRFLDPLGTCIGHGKTICQSDLFVSVLT